MKPPLPEEARSLGPVLAVYEQHTVDVGQAALSGAFGILAIGQSVFRIYNDFFGRNQALLVTLVVVVGLGIAMALVLRYLQATKATKATSGSCIFLLSKGLVAFDGEDYQTHSWSDVRGFRHHGVHGRFIHAGKHEFHVDFDDGSEVVIDSRYPMVAKIGAEIQKKCEPHLYQRYREQLSAGLPLELGDTRLERSGITLPAKGLIPYDRISDIDPDKGTFSLRENGKAPAVVRLDGSDVPPRPGTTSPLSPERKTDGTAVTRFRRRDTMEGARVR